MKPPVTVDTIQPSSGNIFADLKFADPQTALLKAQLTSRICKAIAEKRLTQTKAAELLKLDQPKISALVRGKLGGFSIDRLLRFLSLLGHDIVISVAPSAQPDGRGSIRVK